MSTSVSRVALVELHPGEHKQIERVAFDMVGKSMWRKSRASRIESRGTVGKRRQDKVRDGSDGFLRRSGDQNSALVRPLEELLV